MASIPNNYQRQPVRVTTNSNDPVTVTGSVDIATLPSIATESNPLPVSVDDEVRETLSALRVANELIAAQASRFMPDTSARNRVNVETGTVAVSSLPTLAAVTTVTTVSTVSSVTAVANQTNIGGLAANPQIPYLMMLGGDNLRRNISVTP